MTLGAVFELIAAFFAFPKELLELARLLRKTPEEKRQEILAGARKVADAFEETGRPTWE